MTKTQNFSAMVHDAIAFFGELKDNNNKEWFDENRDRYKQQIKHPADLFVSLVGDDLAKKTKDPIKGKLFRANRDVRFSKDKSPYNVHLHMAWSPGEVQKDGPVWFFGVAPDYITAGFGSFGLQGEQLTKYRAMIDAKGDDLVAAIASAKASVSNHGPEPLKRVPAPYSSDHPHGDLLRRKGLTIEQDLRQALTDPSADAFAALTDAFDAFEPAAEIFRAHL